MVVTSKQGSMGSVTEKLHPGGESLNTFLRLDIPSVKFNRNLRNNYQAAPGKWPISNHQFAF
jgi:hypothetical protein